RSTPGRGRSSAWRRPCRTPASSSPRSPRAVWSVSSRKIIEALIAGERNPGVLASLAVGKLRPKTAQLEEALDGRFGNHHAIVCRQVIDHIDFLDGSIAALSE